MKIGNKNITFVIIILLLIFIVIRTFIGFAERSNSLKDENVKITIGRITDFKHGGKVSPWFYYEFKFNDKSIINQQYIEGDLRKKDNKKLREYIGKKYFVKFSIEKPKYSELYIEKPVPEDFIYKEGQTWSKIPVDYE